VAYQGVRDDSIEGTMLEGQLMGIANLEFQSIADMFRLCEAPRSVDERRTLIHADGFAREVRPASQGAQHCPCATAEFKNVSRRRQLQPCQVLVKQAVERGILGATLESSDETLDSGVVQLIDEAMRVARSHRSSPLVPSAPKQSVQRLTPRGGA
jgi:hypothetical protein